MVDMFASERSVGANDGANWTTIDAVPAQRRGAHSTSQLWPPPFFLRHLPKERYVVASESQIDSSQ